MNSALRRMAGAVSSAVEERLFVEYGSVFATAATPPPTIMFADAAQVEAFQSSLRVDRAVVGEHPITLQADALRALLAAAARMTQKGGSISARAADAGARSYEDTVRLWTRNVTRGLEHWQSLGRITNEHAQAISALTPAQQIAPILELEEAEQLFFGTFFDRSILYSVAAPGASQHLSLLAFDAAEYEDAEVENELARCGWYRTVTNDLPHFTYLGRTRDALPDLGLKRVTRTFGEHVYGFWIPDLDTLG
ncbi:MAG TPA: hypothetical protein VLM38_18810 [Blastocatellia bacterium]|nr:hypothetical protein [Blastocatellia bacterium]